jgi:hypothetical protein
LGRKVSRFLPLSGAGLAEAKADFDRLRVERDDDRLRPLGLPPKLSDYFKDSYTKQLKAVGKRNSTVKKETSCLDKWCEKLSHLRLNKIRPHHVGKVLTGLSEEEYSGRPINLYLIAFRRLIKAAARDGHIKPPPPYEGLQWQRVDQKARQLYTPPEIDLFAKWRFRPRVMAVNLSIIFDSCSIAVRGGVRRCGSDGNRLTGGNHWVSFAYNANRCKVTQASSG